MAQQLEREQTHHVLRSAARYRPFGALRFMLALMVAVSHSWKLLPGSEDLFLRRLGLGNIAVMAFFVLSGFIIAEALHVFYARRPVSFLVNRALRIFPPYIAALVVLVVTFAVLLASGVDLVNQNGQFIERPMLNEYNLASNVVALLPENFVGLVLNPLPANHYLVDGVWAVKEEVYFYLLVFVLFAIAHAGRRLPLGSLIPRVAHTDLAASIAALFLALHVATQYTDMPRPVGLQLLFAPYFAAGIALFLGTRHGWAPLRVVVFVASVVLMALHFAAYVQSQPSSVQAARAGITRPAVLLAVALLLLLVALMAALARREEDSGRVVRWDRQLGLLSYALYLNHGLVLTLFLSSPHVGPVKQPLFVVVAVLVAIVMSRAVEHPMKTWRDRVRGSAL